MKWACEECGKEFARKYNLQRHSADHCQGLKNITIFGQMPSDYNLRNRLEDMSDRLPEESIAAWKKRKFFPPKKQLPEIVVKSEATGTGAGPGEGAGGGYMDQKLAELRQEFLGKLLTLENKVPNEQNGDDEKKIDIVCLAKGDYIKKLIQLHDGDEEKAMNYIKNIGIATDFLEGDFRLIKKIYFDGKKKSEFPIRVKDFKRNKLEYLEENGDWVLDIRGEIVGKRLCDNIVKTLLIANSCFNEVIINEKDEDQKELLLDLFQINKTQAHILKLTERKTQCKLSQRVAEFINYCTEVHAETGSLDNVKKAYD